jgi:hypothetical protein
MTYRRIFGEIGITTSAPQRVWSNRSGQGISAQGCSGTSAENDFSRFGFEKYPDCAGYTIKKDHEKQRQITETIIAAYGDPRSILAGVRG